MNRTDDPEKVIRLINQQKEPIATKAIPVVVGQATFLYIQTGGKRMSLLIRWTLLEEGRHRPWCCVVVRGSGVQEE